MKILLINPKSKALDALPIPPLGILYLAAYVRIRGFKDIKVIDHNRERDLDLEEEISKHDILGLTGTTSQYIEACKLSHIASKHGVFTVYGGSHASARPLESSRHFNAVVVGEGEQAFFDICKKPYDGIYRYEFIKNLDTIPFPARDLIPITEYPTRELKRFDGPYTHMMTGRGCSGKCIFCASPNMWRYPRLASADKVFTEMMHVYKKYGFKNIHFQDDTFTLSKRRVEQLCYMIMRSGIDFKFSCQTRPDMVDEGTLRLMKEAGCVQIEYGVESGDERLLQTARKGYTKKQIKEAFETANKAGIPTYGFFIIGLPGETLKSWFKSVLFALRLKLNSSVWTVLLPYPGTEVYENKMVKILNPNYADWLYKRPIIKNGRLFNLMRNIADAVTNGLFNKGTYKKVKPRNENS